MRSGRRPLAEDDGSLAPAVSDPWGRLPVLSVVGAIGVLVVAVAGAGARASTPWAAPSFWAGLLVAFVPLAARLVSPGAVRLERIGLVVALGLGLYLVKVLHSPRFFTLPDEFLHWRSVEDIVSTGRLFFENPMHPTSALFPGLEVVTAALISLSGLSLFPAGVLVIGAARLLQLLALYLFFEQVTRSERLAGIATVAYVSNPAYLFLDAQFSYESLAVGIAALVLLALARRAGQGQRGRAWWTVAALLGIAALTVTHHITSYALQVYLMIGAALGLVFGRGRPGRAGLGWIALLALLMNGGWLVFAAGQLMVYLRDTLGTTLVELIRIIAGEVPPRRLFVSSAGYVSPLWEQAVTYTSVALIVLALPYGLWRGWARHRGDVVGLTLLTIALTYPLIQAIRLAPNGAEVGIRASASLFVAVGFVLAVATAGWWRGPGPRVPVRAGALVCAAAIVFVGGVIGGFPPAERLPGPHVPGARTRSVDEQAVAAAEWTRRYLDPDGRFAVDFVNRLVQMAYGGREVASLAGGVDVPALFFAPNFGPTEESIVRSGRIRYVLVDRRLSTGVPSTVGFYFDHGEPETAQRADPIRPEALAKFDAAPGLERIYDSGDIVVFDMAVVLNGP